MNRGDPPRGSLRPLGPASLTLCVVPGLILGWLLRPIAEGLGGRAPLITAAQVAALVLIAAVLAVTAWLTHRVIQERRGDLESGRAVNRLVLARAAALVGALVCGGYGGYAVSWLGHGSELAAERFWGSLAACGAGALVVLAALLLERACQVPPDEPESR